LSLFLTTDAKQGVDKICRTPKNMGTNENFMLSSDNSPGPVASEQETYEDHIPLELIDEDELDQAKDEGHHRLADLSFKLRDGILDEDSRLGLKYRALAKRLIK